jgi:hypothetical protein
MTNQDKIIKEIANKHGLSFNQGSDIFTLFGKKLVEELGMITPVNDNGFIDITKLKTISISNFGKFVPNCKAINYANKRRLKLKEEQNEKH